jgi:hypothetical protein
MSKRHVFYSFHYEKDVARVQLIRNIGANEGNNPVSPNNWEYVKRGGEQSIKRWIDDYIKYKSCLVVLVGEQTATRKRVHMKLLKHGMKERVY